MDDRIRELLEAADDPIHDEEPPDLDWNALSERITRLRPKLSLIARAPASMTGWSEIQDASFHSEISLLV